VLDALSEILSDGLRSRDDGGMLASQGHASDSLLAELLRDPFFAVSPPRSTGRERFGRAYAEQLRHRGLAAGMSHADMMATAVELTAASVAEAIARHVATRGPLDVIYASGGGVRNDTLMAALSRRIAPVSLRRADELGVPPDAKEALAFAFLAHQTLCGQPGNVPGATGAAHPVVLGSITPGAPR
jgi:anhydro-N-acetylmuramic acid kinase